MTSIVRCLGGLAADVFFSGTFVSGKYTIGFIRIPSYSPSNTTAALAAFQKEIDFFEKNTDGLIVDEMRNPGGSVSYLNQLTSFLMPKTWRSIPFEVRATSSWVASISSSYESAKAQGAPQSILFEIWYELGVLGALPVAFIVFSALRRGANLGDAIAPCLIGAVLNLFAFACLGLVGSQTWWLTLIAILSIAFSAVIHGRYGTRRPKAVLGR